LVTEAGVVGIGIVEGGEYEGKEIVVVGKAEAVGACNGDILTGDVQCQQLWREM